MRIQPIIFGAMPRTRRLARAISRFQSQKISGEALDEVYRKELKKYLDLVLTYNFSRVSDGMYRWDDLFNPLARYMNIDVDGLKRFYDNNFFFRQPVFREKIRYEEPVVTNTLVRDLRLIGEIERVGRISISLPGPLTLVANSIIERSVYSSDIELARDYIEKVVMREIEAAYKSGLRHIDLHEPELVFSERGVDQYIDLYKRVAESFRVVTIWIPIYFRYSREVVRALLESLRDYNIVPIIDLVSRRTNPEDIARDLSGARTVGLGLVDARNTKLERASDLHGFVERISGLLRDLEELYIAPNTHLEYLPEKIAVRKIRLLGRLSWA